MEPGKDKKTGVAGGQPAPVILRAERLRHSYDGILVVDIEELELRRGETLCLVGPNGAGKSTLVRLLNLVEAPQQGRIMIDGADAGRRSIALRRRLAGVFQRPHMFHGTVADNVRYGLKLRGIRGAEAEVRIAESLDLLGIGGLAGNNARRLSGGQAQRVALARALAVQPYVLFLDEPAASLDPAARDDFHQDLRRVARDRELTVVYVTHYLQEAMAVADRLALLVSGELREIGPAEEVYHRPRHPLTARFLGVENLLPGRVVDVAAGGAVVELYGGSRVYTRALVSGSVLACIRGQEITLHAPALSEAPAWTANRYPAIVEEISLAGSSCRVGLDCGGFRLVASVPRAVLRRLDAVVGAEVEARFDEDAVHLIETGRGAGRKRRPTVPGTELPGDLQPEWFTEEGWRGSDN